MATTSSDYGAMEWFRSHRIGLGPVYLGIPVLALGLTARFTLSLTQTMIGLVVLAASGFALASKRPGQGLRKAYFAAITMFVCGWILAAHLTPDTRAAWTWLMFSLVVGGAALAIPWWRDNMKRTHVKLEHMVRSWRIRADRIKLGDTALTNVANTPIGWAGKLRWLPGAHTVDEVASRRAEIEGALNLQAGQLRMPLDGKSTNSINVVAVLRDPHAVSLPWEIPTDEINDQTVLRQHKISDGAPIGVREDGVRRLLKLFTPGWGAHQILIAGVKGSGKSVALNLIWGFLACCTDAVQWGIDLKGGMELAPWRRAFDWVVNSKEDAWRMIACVEAIIDKRAEDAATRGWKVWQPSSEYPVLVVSMDEVASMLGTANNASLEMMADLARKGRAVGVVLIMATQYPTLDALGSSQVRSQIDQRLCFRMSDASGEDYIITAGPVDAHKIDSDRPGTYYHQDGDKLDKMPYRTYTMSDGTIVQLVDVVAGHTTSLDAVSVSAAETVEMSEDDPRSPYSLREVYIPKQRDGIETDDENGTENDAGENETDDENGTENGGDGTEMTPPPFETGEVSLEQIAQQHRASQTAEQRAASDAARAAYDTEGTPLGEAGAIAKLTELLRAAGEEGVSAKDLYTGCTRRSTWFYEQINPMLQDGTVRRTKHGTYAWSDSVAHAE